MKKIQTIFAVSLLVVLGAFVFTPAGSVGAAGPLDAVCVDNADSEVCQNKDDSSDSFVSAIINTLLYVVGAVSVLAIIIGGIFYTISGGSSSNVTKAKNTIIYAVVGLVVSFLAYAIVNWVFNVF